MRVRIDGNLYELSEEIKLEKNIKHNIDIIVDRLVVKAGIENRLTDSIETVMSLSNGLMTVDVIGGEPVNFSQSFSLCRTDLARPLHRSNRRGQFVAQFQYHEEPDSP